MREKKLIIRSTSSEFLIFEIISYHLANIFKDFELEEEAVVKKYLTTASDGKKYNTNYYNLDDFDMLMEESEEKYKCYIKWN